MAVKRTRGRRRQRTKPAWGESVQSTEEQREVREQILFETAGRLFNRFGFHGTSMSVLTEELGLTKGALYYYVKDKSDLLYQLHLKSAKATRRAYAAGVAEGANGREKVRAIMRHYLEAVTQSHTETFVLLEEGALDEEQTRDILERRKELEKDLRAQIQLGIDDGSIVPCDPKLACFSLVGAMAWVSKWYERDGEMSAQEVAKSISDLLTRMLDTNPSPDLTLRRSATSLDAED